MESKYKYQQLKVTELLLNPENPRFDPVKYQTETIEAMIEDQSDKLVELAKHISDFGLSPMDIVLVQPFEKQWIVREGNRRVTVLKLLNEPDLIPAKYTKIKKEFQKLNVIFDKTIVSNILCVIIDDVDLANEWIRLKHTGENKGVGTVGWDGQQTGRFRTLTSGKVDQRIIFLDSLRNSDEIPMEYKNQFSKIKKTNFERLMNDPDIRELLEITVDDGEYKLKNGVNLYLKLVLHDLINNNLNVGAIYYKDDRRKYLQQLKDSIEKVEIDLKKTTITTPDEMPTITEIDNEPPLSPPLNVALTTSEADSETTKEVPPDLRSNGGSATYGTDKEVPPNKMDTQGKQGGGSLVPVRAKSYPINRKTLIPAQHRLSITHARILKIYNELKSIDCDVYPNAVAALFRVFIELSTDCYIENKGIISVTCNSTLTQKIEAVANDLESKSIMNKHGLRTARQMASSHTQNTSVKTFHSYVHNKDVTPVSLDLKTAWDDLWPFIENMWR